MLQSKALSSIEPAKPSAASLIWLVLRDRSQHQKARVHSTLILFYGGREASAPSRTPAPLAQFTMLFPVCFKGFLDVADNMIRRKKLVQNKLDTVLSEAENSLQAARFFMRSDLESERNKAAEHAANALRLALGAARNACVKPYKISSDLPENTSESVENFSAGEASTGLFALENEVKIAFLPRAVLLQMPLLWTKSKRQQTATYFRTHHHHKTLEIQHLRRDQRQRFCL